LTRAYDLATPRAPPNRQLPTARPSTAPPPYPALQDADLGEGDADKLSPMNLDSSFWTKKGPKRVHDAERLKAAIRLAEERTLHSTFAGAGAGEVEGAAGAGRGVCVLGWGVGDGRRWGLEVRQPRRGGAPSGM
jgi:hypothetical protein